MSEIISNIVSKLVEQFCPILIGKDEVTVRIRNVIGLIFWIATAMVSITLGFMGLLNVWVQVRTWTNAPIIPTWWPGGGDSLSIIFFELLTVSVVFAIFYILDVYQPAGMGDAELYERSATRWGRLHKITKAMSIASFLTAAIIAEVEWDLLQKLLDAYCWLRSLL